MIVRTPMTKPIVCKVILKFRLQGFVNVKENDSVGYCKSNLHFDFRSRARTTLWLHGSRLD